MKRQGEGGIIGAANDPEMGGGLTEFTSSGNFTANPGTDSIEWLVIAGGGGGGGDDWGIGGGGGAGGYRNSFNSEQSGGGASSESPSPITGGNTYTVTVGAGGVGAPCEPGQTVAGSDGSDSSISGTGITTITSTGGGGGGKSWPAADALPGRSGGSGGGTSHRDSSIAWPGGPDHYAGGAGTANQGYAGGSVTSTNWWGWGGSGGGGAGGAGTRDSVVTACPDPAGCPWDPNYPSGNFWYWHAAGGLGGVGLSSSITGLPIGRAGGAWGGSASHGNIPGYPLAPQNTTQTARTARVAASGLSTWPSDGYGAGGGGMNLKGWGYDMHDVTIEEGGTSVDNVYLTGSVPGWGQHVYKQDFRTTWGAGISQEELMSHATGFSDAIANTGSGGGSGTGNIAPYEPWAGPMPARRNSGTGGSGYVAIVEPRTITSASGIWSLDDVINYKKEGNWE